jgi:hypothetical protein
LAGALVYISQTRDVLIGGSALFAMAVGMSVPLLLVGLSAGTLLPRAGSWMDAVKPFFGVLMLALALWMIASLIPAIVLMLGWGVLGLGYGAFLIASKKWGVPAKALGLVFVLLGLLQLGGLASGGRDAWAPLAHLSGTAQGKVKFSRVKTLADLDNAIRAAHGRPVAVDFNIQRPVQQNVHVVPQPNPAAMCGFAQRTSRKSGSRLTERNPRYFHRILTRPNGHPPQRTPIPHANCCGGLLHSVSRGVS